MKRNLNSDGKKFYQYQQNQQDELWANAHLWYPPLFGKQEVGIWWIQKRFPRYGVHIWSLWPNIRSLPSIVAEKKCDEKCTYMFNVYKNQLSRQTGSRNLTGPKTLPTIWYTYMTLVTKYQISTINSCWEKYFGQTEVKQYTPLPLWGAGV